MNKDSFYAKYGQLSTDETKVYKVTNRAPDGIHHIAWFHTFYNAVEFCFNFQNGGEVLFIDEKGGMFALQQGNEQMSVLPFDRLKIFK